jgi:hypothetical protein
MTEIQKSDEPKIWPPQKTYAIEFTPNAKKASIFAFHHANDTTLQDWARSSGHAKHLLPASSPRMFGITLPSIIAEGAAQHLDALGYTRDDTLLQQKRVHNEKRAKHLQKIIFVPPDR